MFTGVDCIMVLSQYTKQRILVYYFDGTKSSTRLKKLLEEEGIHISRVSVSNLFTISVRQIALLTKKVQVVLRK